MGGDQMKLCGGESRWEMSVTERRFAVRAGGSNILILCALCLSIGHGGVWRAVISSRRNIGQSRTKLIWRNLSKFVSGRGENIYSSKLGSKPSKTILFLMAITGTPWEKINTCYLTGRMHVFNRCITVSDSPLGPFLDIVHNVGPWPLCWHSPQLLLVSVFVQVEEHSEEAATWNSTVWNNKKLK